MNLHQSPTFLFGCLLASFVGAQTPTSDDLYTRSVAMQDKALNEMEKFNACIDKYVEKNFSALATADEIAQAAVSDCRLLVDSYVNYLSAAGTARAAITRSETWAELDRRIKAARLEAEQSGEKLAAQGKGDAVKYTLALRAKAQRAQGQPGSGAPERPTPAAK